MPTTKGRAYNCPPMPAHRLAAVKREAAIMARGTDAKKGTRNKEAVTELNRLKRAARHAKKHPNDKNVKDAAKMRRIAHILTHPESKPAPREQVKCGVNPVTGCKWWTLGV